MVIMSPNFMVSGPPVMHSGTLLSSHLHFGSALHPINITVVDFFFFVNIVMDYQSHLTNSDNLLSFYFVHFPI